MKLSLVSLLALAACYPSASAPSAADITAFGEDQLSCVEMADARTNADTCREASRAAFCRSWPTMPNCVQDGGGQ